jgi:beta-galactosidase
MRYSQLNAVTAILQMVWAAVALSASSQPAIAQVTDSPPRAFAIGDDAFLLDGQPFVIRCGEVHAARVPKEYWRHRLQLAKAMGLNTVCAYLFWNVHEPRPGEFNWSDRADVAEYCRIAQELGLWVILRPGPYACAEWEMGGLPSWLLKDPSVRMRSRDPKFIEPARRYLAEVGRVLAPLQITRGGPIIMVQAENEYGFYGDDAQYMGEIRQALVDAGFDVPLFACNPKDQLRRGWREDLFPVVNFGSDPRGAFAALRRVLPKGPLMCGEFYPGWFDTWGAPHHTGNTASYLADLESMLKNRQSFSIYMAHGGTTFDFFSGADRPFKPDTSSYDYDAPISEAGWPTEKFAKTRELFARYLNPGEAIPEPPARNPVIAIPATAVTEVAPLMANLPAPRDDAEPRTFEALDQAFGCILYRTKLPAGPAAELTVDAVHDVGYVFLDGQRVGFFDRRSRGYRVALPERAADATLDILVEAMGRVNFGPEVHDQKGIHAPVRVGGAAVSGWEMHNLPLDDAMLAKLNYSTMKDQQFVEGPAFYRATVQAPTPGDTFLDMRPWGKGYAWVNGHNLGRYWNIGPQQTMYIPGPWLKAGANEIVILDLLGPQKPTIAGLETPILDMLRPELDFARPEPRPPVVDVAKLKLAHEAAFEPGTDVQTVMFAAPHRGRVFVLQSQTAHDGQPFAAVAEIVLLDAAGQPLDAANLRVAGVDSEEREREDGSAGNAIDGQTANFWHTQWGAAQPPHPHQLVLDLGEPATIGGFRYTPRQGAPNVGGRIKDYRVYVGDLPPQS